LLLTLYRVFSVAFCCQKRRVTGQNKRVGIFKKHQNKVDRFWKFTVVFQSACRLLYTQKTFVLTCRFCLFTVTQPFLKEYIYFQHFQNNFYSILELYITIMVVLVWNPQCVGVHFNLFFSPAPLVGGSPATFNWRQWEVCVERNWSHHFYFIVSWQTSHFVFSFCSWLGLEVKMSTMGYVLNTFFTIYYLFVSWQTSHFVSQFTRHRSFSVAFNCQKRRVKGQNKRVRSLKNTKTKVSDFENLPLYLSQRAVYCTPKHFLSSYVIFVFLVWHDFNLKTLFFFTFLKIVIFRIGKFL